MSNLSERIRRIVNLNYNSDREFEREIGVSYGRAVKQIKKNVFSSDVLERIMKKHPDVSLDWLFLGLGSMYSNSNEDYNQTDEKDMQDMINVLTEQLKVKDKQISAKDEQIRFLQQRILRLEQQAKSEVKLDSKNEQGNEESGLSNPLGNA